MLSRREEKLLRGLSQRKVRETEGCFSAEGVRVVEDLLASPLRVRFLVYSSSLEDSERGRALLAGAERQGVRRCQVGDVELARLADTQTPQGVIAVAEIPEAPLDALHRLRPLEMVLLLDAVQDPGNLGTLVRTAEALGVTGVVALPGTVDPWNPKAVRAAAGSSFRVPLVASSWEEAGPWLHNHGFQILAADREGTPLGDERPDRAALVVGNEGSGLTPESRIFADRTVSIPLRGRAESLNVAAAAAILLYELLR